MFEIGVNKIVKNQPKEDPIVLSCYRRFYIHDPQHSVITSS